MSDNSTVSTENVRGGEGLRLRGARREPGTTVGRYVLGAVLGEGGMGAVYAAHDPQLDRKVAIKLLDARLGTADSSMQLRLAREAQAMARLSHPNVLTIYDLGMADDGQVFIAVELIEGGTLSQWLKQRPRRWREMLAMFLEAGEGLAAAHQAGIIHRDFKPDNVLVATDGRPRVTDFGLACTVGLQAAAPPPTVEFGPPSEFAYSGALSNPLTRAGTVMGTPGYMAPEQYRAEAADERTDIYCFAGSLYHALYGERPFDGKSFDELSRSVQAGQVREAPRHSKVPPWLRSVVVGAMAVDKDGRPSSMRALLEALRRDPARARRRWAAVATVVAVVGAGLGVRHELAQRQLRACQALPHRLSGVWDEARKQSLAQTFRKSGAHFADEAWSSVRRGLDEYAGRWSSMAVSACEAALVTRVESEALYAQRSACLDERLDGLRALTDVFVFVDADARAVRKMAEATQGLDDLSTCGDAARLSTIPLLPGDPARRREIEALRRQLQRARALSGAGQLNQSLALLHEVDARVQKSGYAPLQARYWLQRAAYEHNQEEKAAVADFERGILIADASRLDELRAEGEIHLGSMLGSQLGRTEEGHLWLRQAGAVIDRLGRDPALAASRDVREAWMFRAEWKMKEATQLFERALAECAASPVVDVVVQAGALSGLSDCRAAEGRIDEAVQLNQQALALLEGRFGAHDESALVVRMNLALTQLQAGRPDAALADAQTGMSIVEQKIAAGDIERDSWDEAVGQQTLGQVYLRLGRLDEARSLLERARAVFRRMNDVSNVVEIDNDLAQTLRRLGRLDEASRRVDDAEELLKRHDDVPEVNRALTLSERAQTLLARDPRQAVVLLERALTAGAKADPYDLATVQLGLARALRRARTEPARAQQLARDALATFERLHDQAQAAEATRLVAAAP